ncbi:agamous-like MADS-box protein AGL61 [Andrographis paniculata]|uniref:agamous-like MADS-box protein AGL61 n=1 Tax=Andrographis paniculata TaxID=175694 RepID=UPI0021E95643|nr:agamous-like MADS-box protein AGL61 [Andrographis paniculata]
MAARQTRGRQIIPMQQIENRNDMYATFTKRRHGLYNKASELSTLCGVDIGIIIFSPTGNPYSFFQSSMESVLERFRNPNQPMSNESQLLDAQSRNRMRQLNQQLDEILESKDELKEKDKQLDEVDDTRPKGWWEEVPVGNLDAGQVQEWITWFEALQSQVQRREQMRRS